MKIDKLKDEEISKVKLEMLNKLVECEENKLHSKIHPLFCHYFPEWILTSKKLIKTIYKRILKTEPSIFLNFSNADSLSILAGKAEKIRNNIDEFVKINIDYDCIKNIVFVLLNCMHYLKWKKKSISSFLIKETLNTISKEISTIFMELESIKSIRILHFDNFPSREPSLKSINTFDENKKKYINISNDLNKSKSFNNLIKSNSCKESFVKNEEMSSDFVYIFHLLLGFIFPNQLEIELNFNLDSILNKYRNADGLLKDHKKVCRKYEKYLVILLLTTYFISKNEKIQKLKLDVNESNLLETYYLIQSCQQIKNDLKLEFKIKEFTFLDNFDRSTNFYGLELTFNCLDDILFNKLNNITFKNFGLRSLNITFFPKECNNFCQKQGLNKIYKIKEAYNLMDNFCSDMHEENSNQSMSGFDFLNSKNKNKIFYFNNTILDEELQNEECEDVYDKIYDLFNSNLKTLFIVIESKINILRNLIITLNPPNNILDEMCYVSSFTVFIYNLLKLLGKENSEISQIEINSEIIPLNFQLVGQNKKNLGIDLRKTKIENLIFNLKIENYFNITRFIPESIVCLKLSSLTYETLTVLVNKLKKKFNLYKNLIELSLNVYLSNKDLESLLNTTKEFFKLNKPKNIEILNFRMQYVLKNNHVDDILDIIHNKSNVHNYNDKIFNYDLKFSCNGRIDINKKFFKLDERNLSRILALVFCFNKSSKLIKLTESEKIKINVSLYLYSYTKNVKLS